MVVVTNLNRRLKSPQEKAVAENKAIDQGIGGPSRVAQDFNRPNPFLGKFDENVRSDTFYQEFPFDSAQDAQAKIDFLQNFGGNSFSDPEEIMNFEQCGQYSSGFKVPVVSCCIMIGTLIKRHPDENIGPKTLEMKASLFFVCLVA